jgi:hypothetical protein
MFNPVPAFSAERQVIFQPMNMIRTPSPPGEAPDDPAIDVPLKPVKYVNREFRTALKKLIEQSGVMTMVFPQSPTPSDVGSHHSSPSQGLLTQPHLLLHQGSPLLHERTRSISPIHLPILNIESSLNIEEVSTIFNHSRATS